MAKPMLVTLPVILLLLDYWPLERFDFGRQKKMLPKLIVEKISFFALSAVSSVITFIVQQRGGSVSEISGLPLWVRLANCVTSYTAYIYKMIWPVRLSIFYPHPGYNIPIWNIVFSAALIVVVSAGIIYLAQRHKYLLTGWFWYLVTLLPVIGLVQVGEQAIADRYTYVTLTGLFIVIAWGLPELFRKWLYGKYVLTVSGAAAVLVLGFCAYIQTSCWKDAVKLFTHSLAVTGDENFMAHACLGDAAYVKHDYNLAARHFAKAIEANHKFVSGYIGLGITLAGQKKFNEAVENLSAAVKLDNNSEMAHFNLAEGLSAQGKYEQAVKEYKEALRIRPDYPQAYNNIGVVLNNLGRYDEAVAQFKAAIKIAPRLAEAYNNIAFVLTRKGELEQAAANFQQVLKLDPNFPHAKENLELILAEIEKNKKSP